MGLYFSGYTKNEARSICMDCGRWLQVWICNSTGFVIFTHGNWLLDTGCYTTNDNKERLIENGRKQRID